MRIFSILRCIVDLCNEKLRKYEPLSHWLLRVPNIYHSRLEHSKGVYNRKLEEFLYHFQDSNWRKYIDENNLKLSKSQYYLGKRFCFNPSELTSFNSVLLDSNSSSKILSTEPS